MHVEDLRTWFHKRGYPDYRSDENNSKQVDAFSLVVTYNPSFKNLFQVIRKNLQSL